MESKDSETQTEKKLDMTPNEPESYVSRNSLDDDEDTSTCSGSKQRKSGTNKIGAQQHDGGR